MVVLPHLPLLPVMLPSLPPALASLLLPEAERVAKGADPLDERGASVDEGSAHQTAERAKENEG